MGCNTNKIPRFEIFGWEFLEMRWYLTVKAKARNGQGKNIHLVKL